MILANMISIDDNALQCDLAETYHIFNYKELPATKVALFCVGLRDNSRIKMKISKTDYDFNTILLASIVDRLSLLVWSKTKGAEKGKGKPEMLVNKLLKKNDSQPILSFDSAEEFEEERKKILRGGK